MYDLSVKMLVRLIWFAFTWLALIFPVKVDACLTQFSANIESSDVRLEYARKLESMAAKMYEAIPTIKSSDKQWLKTELASKDATRRMKARRSSEIKKDHAKSGLGKLKSITETLVRLLGRRKEMGAEYSFHSEARLWTQVAVILGFQNLLVDIIDLQNRKEIDLSKIVPVMLMPGDDFGESFLFACKNTSNWIIDLIVLKYFAGTLE